MRHPAQRGRRVKVAPPYHEVLAPPFDWVVAAFMGLDCSAWSVRQVLPPDDAEEVVAAYQPAGRHLCAVMNGADLAAHERAIEDAIAELDDVLERVGVIEVAWQGLCPSLSRYGRRRYRAAVLGLAVLYNNVPRTPEFKLLELAERNQIEAAIFAALDSVLRVLVHGKKSDARAVASAFRHLDKLLGKIHVRPVFPLHRPDEELTGPKRP